jgi:hypothetical protein
MNVEQAMRLMRHPISWFGAVLGVIVLTVFHWSVSLAAVVPSGSAGAPGYVQAGLPFVVRDGYATQVCISSHSGRPLPPFVAPADAFSPDMPFDAFSTGMPLGGQQRIGAGIPFTVNDSFGTVLCMSTRGGQVLLPFVVP